MAGIVSEKLEVQQKEDKERMRRLFDSNPLFKIPIIWSSIIFALSVILAGRVALLGNSDLDLWMEIMIALVLALINSLLGLLVILALMQVDIIKAIDFDDWYIKQNKGQQVGLPLLFGVPGFLLLLFCPILGLVFHIANDIMVGLIFLGLVMMIGGPLIGRYMERRSIIENMKNQNE